MVACVRRWACAGRDQLDGEGRSGAGGVDPDPASVIVYDALAIRQPRSRARPLGPFVVENGLKISPGCHGTPVRSVTVAHSSGEGNGPSVRAVCLHR